MIRIGLNRILVTCLMALVLLPATGAAQPTTTDDRVLEGVRLDQRLRQQVPLSAPFTDEHGEATTLGQLAGDKPVLLVPVFYNCPMLCTQVLNALARTVREVSFTPGEDFEVVVFTIDPRESHTLAAEKKLNYLKRHGQIEVQDGWHFLVAEQPAIESVSESIGYHYVYDEESDGYAHPAAVAILTPEGKVSRYLLGLDYEPRDLRFALMDASQGGIGSVIDKAILRCFNYDPTTGRYGFAIMTALRVGGVTTLALMICAIVGFERRRRRRGLDSSEPGGGT